MTPSRRTPAQDDESLEWLERIARRVSNWGRWGSDDERGTLNLISPEHLARAATLVRRGEAFDLSIPINKLTPQPGDLRSPPLHIMTETGDDQTLPNDFHYADDYVVMALQGATQWDGLSHVYYDDQLYNGHPASSVGPHGAGHCGIERIAPGVVGRAVLIDLPRCQGKEWLERGEAISPDDLDAAILTQGCEVGEGDILLIRTGWWAQYLGASDRDAKGKALRGEAGLSIDCAEWLWRRGVAAVAADNYAVEVVPSERPGAMLPLHLLLIRDMGMTIGEMFDLEALSHACSSENVYEFLFVATTLKVTGGVGSPTTPIALL